MGYKRQRWCCRMSDMEQNAWVCRVCLQMPLSACFPAHCPVDRYWWMWTACSLSLSSPQHWSLLGDLWSPGADPQPNYVGGAQLDWAPIYLPHSTQAQTQRGDFFIFPPGKCWVLSGPQITRGDRVEVFTQAAGLELDIRVVDEMFSQHATCLSADDGWPPEPNGRQWYVVLHALKHVLVRKGNCNWVNQLF